jgi:hypothetical protein
MKEPQGSNVAKGALAIGAHAAAPRSATSAVVPAGKERVHEAGAYADLRPPRQGGAFAQRELASDAIGDTGLS